MDQRWRQMEQIFHEASEMDAQGRSAYLDRVCADDAELRAEVESLLAADGQGQQFFGEAVGRVAESIPDDGSMEGQSIGPYTIEREIGRGGMGAVYLARRKGDFSKRVAIKLVKRGMDTDQIVSRFRQERQILANLEHPNIARLLDGGATQDGRPYLVMEYVEGQPIHRYCKEYALSVRKRLELFLQVCDGVLCAHRNLVIHRDLKPGNILVNAEGIVKLLDFGIAKLLDPNVEGETAPRTMIGTPLLTPDYASPEQVRGAAVSVSTDVYSLGAVLYELLAGCGPHRFESMSAAEIERVICEGPVPPLSAAAGEPLGRELDSIAAMALRKEPERRYASVEQLGEDARRYLDGRAVLACPDTWTYRASRVLKRNAKAAIAAGVAIVGLLGGLGVAMVQAQAARGHATRAERRFAEVRKLAKSILYEHYDQIRELPGATKAKESMAKVSQEYLNSLAGEADDPALLLELANAYRRLAEVQGAPGSPNLGQIPQAIANFRKAIELLDRLPPQEWNKPAVLEAATNTLWRLSRSLQNDGRFEEAQQLALRQASLAERLHALQPKNVNAAIQYLTAHRALSTNALRRNDVDGAVRYAKQAVQIAEQVASENSPAALLGAKAANYHVLADAIWEQGDLPGAQTLFAKYVEMFAALAAQKPNEQYFTHSLYFGHYKLGKLHSAFHRLNLADSAKGEKHCREYLDWARRMVQADAADALARQSIGHGNLCVGIAVAMRSPLEAMPYLEAARRHAVDELARHPVQVSQVNAAFAWFVAADTQAAAGKKGAAQESFANALALYDSLEKQKLSAEDHTDMMLANRQYALFRMSAEHAKRAVAMAPAVGKVQALVHAAQAREVLALVSPPDHCPALRQAVSIWEKVKAAPFTAMLAEKRLLRLQPQLGRCAAP